MLHRSFAYSAPFAYVQQHAVRIVRFGVASGDGLDGIVERDPTLLLLGCEKIWRLEWKALELVHIPWRSVSYI